MNHRELKEQQAVQLKMLVDFDTFCNEHGLKYFMVYGTLLGAIRHKGFIPWDYDIDMAMTRSEYEKFMKVQHLLPSHLTVWEVCYSDIRHSGLVRLLTDHNAFGRVQVDIFIFDYARECWSQNRIMGGIFKLLHFARLSKLEKSILMKRFSGQQLKQGVIQLAKVVRVCLGGSANAERLLHYLRVSKKPTNQYISIECKVPLPTSCFVEPQRLEFGGHLLYAPMHAEELLTKMYGNYMEIPPEGHKWLKEEGLE